VGLARGLRNEHLGNPEELVLPAAFLGCGGDVRHWMNVSTNSAFFSSQTAIRTMTEGMEDTYASS
jgi:anthranilate phosphoribosyltransferase